MVKDCLICGLKQVPGIKVSFYGFPPDDYRKRLWFDRLHLRKTCKKCPSFVPTTSIMKTFWPRKSLIEQNQIPHHRYVTELKQNVVALMWKIQMEYFMTPIALNLTASPAYYIKQELPEMPQEDAILDLCVRKRIRMESPDYTLSYPSPKRTPEYTDPLSTSFCTRGVDSMSDCSDTNSLSSLMSPDLKPKTRPFKAFPKDPLEVVPRIPPLQESDMDYDDFRRKMLAQVQASHNLSNKNMRRNQVQTGRNTDPEYLEKRKKNNEAAKRSRDARKAKEDEIAIRCAYLEQQNLNLKFKLDALNDEVDKLRRILYR